MKVELREGACEERNDSVTAAVGEIKRLMHIIPYITVEAVRIVIPVTAVVSSESKIQVGDNRRENKQSPPSSHYLGLFQSLTFRGLPT